MATEIEKIKRLILVNVPINTCNFRCKYCYITQTERWGDKIEPFKYSAEQIGKALSKSRLGGTCLINLCAGGETLLAPEMPAVIRVLLEEGHYVEVVTNGTINKRIDEILEFPSDLLNRLVFKLSFHYEELIKLNKIDSFFANAERLKDAGCSITIELTTFDGLIDKIAEIQRVCFEKTGALCHLTIGRDDTDPKTPIASHYPKEKYREIWSSFSSPMLDFKLQTYYVKRKEFCYAGDWSLYVSLGTGVAKQCYKSNFTQNIFDDVLSRIKFRPIGKFCQEPHCYNSHSLLTCGTIPEFDSPTYLDMRNRYCSDGSEWFTDKAKKFYSSKLNESNREYGLVRKQMNTVAHYRDLFTHTIRDFSQKIVNKYNGKYYDK